MDSRPASVSNPADLLLRIRRTPDGLRITSPQIPHWAVLARGPVPIAQALDSGFIELACAAYAACRGESYDLPAWDAAAETFAASGGSVLVTDSVAAGGSVLRDGEALRRSGRRAVQRPLTRVASIDRPATGKFVPQHDPFAWTDLGNSQWRSPSGAIYGEATRQVQGMLRRRGEAEAARMVQPTLDDVAS